VSIQQRCAQSGLSALPKVLMKHKQRYGGTFADPTYGMAAEANFVDNKFSPHKQDACFNFVLCV
jgi:hypothetical protein